RPAFLDGAIGDNLELRAAVETLLRSAESSAGTFTVGAAGAYPELVARLAAEVRPAEEQIGPYRIVGQAGEGGMGIVYIAERADEQYRSRVALKVIRAEINDPVFVRRFLDERQILASLAHPGIARLYDGGVTPDGRPWFAMELVEGMPISHYCDAKRLTVEQRLRLMLSACDAVACAHRNFVIHRDLKPFNILVDGEGRVRLVDFGIAKMLAATEAADAPASIAALTPGYASPELLRGERVSAASDVYSLGVILYRLLTGRRPFRAAAPTAAEPLHGGFILPSEMALKSDAAMLFARQTQVRMLARKLRGDLDAIVLSATAKELNRRYAMVDDFAADIQRYLDNKPVSVRAATLWYRSGKFVRRNPIAAGAAGIISILAIAFGIATRTQLNRVERERAVTEQVAAFLATILRAPSPSPTAVDADGAMNDALDRALTRLNTPEISDPLVRARAYDVLAGTYWQRGRIGPAHEAADSALALGQLARADAQTLRVYRERVVALQELRRSSDRTR
ncbi:MAG TPA: serine/threonine-protein kinase, partial [Gemmatimonadaceae bacterium]